MFLHEDVASLPRFQEELEFGDIAIVYHSVSTYDVTAREKTTFTQATTALSLNLYGVALVAKWENDKA